MSCGHLYCAECITKLSSCAVCRMKKMFVQRIYLPVFNKVQESESVPNPNKKRKMEDEEMSTPVLTILTPIQIITEPTITSTASDPRVLFQDLAVRYTNSNGLQSNYLNDHDNHHDRDNEDEESEEEEIFTSQDILNRLYN